MKANQSILFFLSLFVFMIAATSATAQTVPNSDTAQAAERRLSEAQLQSIKSIQTKWAKLAAPLALHLAVTVKAVYANMLRDKEDARLRERLGAEMHTVAGELLAIKGQSIREVLHVLTPIQKLLIKNEMGKANAPADLMELTVRTFNIPEK